MKAASNIYILGGSQTDFARNWAREHASSSAEQLSSCIDKLAVDIGCEILSIIPGRISTEVDARPQQPDEPHRERVRAPVDLDQLALLLEPLPQEDPVDRAPLGHGDVDLLTRVQLLVDRDVGEHVVVGLRKALVLVLHQLLG